MSDSAGDKQKPILTADWSGYVRRWRGDVIPTRYSFDTVNPDTMILKAFEVTDMKAVVFEHVANVT